MHLLDYVVLIGYFVVMIGIGTVSYFFKTKKQEDFFMGGRGFGKLLQTFAAFGAGTGANDPIQTGRTVWTSGLSGIWSVLMWLFVTPFYWIFGVWYRRMRLLTLGDWFVERYESKAMGVAYTIFAFAFSTMYLSSAFSAISKVAAPMIGDDAIAALGISDPESLKYYLLPTIAVVVIIYGALGGLTAAYWTDLIQGLCIIALSLILIPTGLSLLVTNFGGGNATGMMDGFRIMHERVPADYFQMFTGPHAGEFPVHYIISLTLLGLLGIVVQPHFIATGGGTAKTEYNARVGLVTGNFLKRFCTIGWAITGLIVLALLAGDLKANIDPDYAWGTATLQILGPLQLGLVGLMLACLLAALMSTADCYMLITAALVVRNIYAAYFDPEATEKKYVNIGRLAGVLVITGATVLALYFYNVFQQFKIALEITIVFAAPFWVGMFWRRANKWSAWLTIAFSATVFFVIPILAPVVVPALRTNPAFTITNDVVITTITRPATDIDVERRQAWDAAYAEAQKIEDDEERAKATSAIGPAPPVAEIGKKVDEVIKTGGRSIFWTDGVKLVGKETVEEVSSETEGNKKVVIQRRSGDFEGEGRFNLDFLIYQWMGIDLTKANRALLETLRLPPRLITPFVVMILLSLVTPRNGKETLDRYYVKMKTPVDPDPEEDHRQLELSYKEPDRFNHRLLLPGTGLEIQKPTVTDIVGFVISVGICFVFIGIAVWLANIGAK